VNRRTGTSVALWLMLLSVLSAAIAETGRVTSAACAWSGTWASSDGSITQTIKLTGKSLKGSYTQLDEECPHKITGSTRLTLNPDGMTARGTYHENDNSCWGASSGAIVFALDAGANRIDYSVLTEEGERFSDFMLRRQAATLLDCDPKKQVVKAAGPESVKKNKTAKTVQPKAVKGNSNARMASRYVPYKILDQDRNMVAAVIKMPADWVAQSNVV